MLTFYAAYILQGLLIVYKTGTEGKYQQGNLHDAKACNTSTSAIQNNIEDFKNSMNGLPGTTYSTISN